MACYRVCDPGIVRACTNICVDEAPTPKPEPKPERKASAPSPQKLNCTVYRGADGGFLGRFVKFFVCPSNLVTVFDNSKK